MNYLTQNKNFALGFIILISALVFIPLIGNSPLFDWDEINFAECAREMVVTGNYSQVQLNYNPFWEKPPFFIWLQAISMNVFGINEFAARLPNAICGIISLCMIFLIGRKINSHKFGLVWALVYAGTLLPHFYSKSGIIDPWFNLFIFLSFYQILLHINNPVANDGLKTAILAGFFLGLAVLTKGPAALLIIGISVLVFLGMKRFQKVSSVKFVLIFCLSLMLTGFSWFLIELLRGNSDVISSFIEYQIRLFKTEDSDHGGFLLYHFVILLIGCFPSSLFMLLAFKKSGIDTPFQKHIKLGMLILFFVVLGIFTIVKTKIVHYSSLCYFPLTYLATYSILRLIRNEMTWSKWFKIAFVAISGLLGIAFLLIGSIQFITPFIINSDFIKDEFALENLKADVHWQGWEWILGIIYIGVSLIALLSFLKGKKNAILGLYSFYILFIATAINVFIPKIEQYTQHAAIEFYKAIADKNFYVETSGFKSYAYLFYGNKQPYQNENADCKVFVEKNLDEMEAAGHNRLTSYSVAYVNWMLFGKIDRPAIIVCKSNNYEGILKYGTFKKLYSKNGYVFCLRMPE